MEIISEQTENEAIRKNPIALKMDIEARREVLSWKGNLKIQIELCETYLYNWRYEIGRPPGNILPEYYGLVREEWSQIRNDLIRESKRRSFNEAMRQGRGLEYVYR